MDFSENLWIFDKFRLKIWKFIKISILHQFFPKTVDVVVVVDSELKSMDFAQNHGFW